MNRQLVALAAALAIVAATASDCEDFATTDTTVSETTNEPTADFEDMTPPDGPVMTVTAIYTRNGERCFEARNAAENRFSRSCVPLNGRADDIAWVRSQRIGQAVKY